MRHLIFALLLVSLFCVAARLWKNEFRFEYQNFQVHSNVFLFIENLLKQKKKCLLRYNDKMIYTRLYHSELETSNIMYL